MGKPNPFAFELIRDRFKAEKEKFVMIGDRPSTDIAFANSCGIDSCLVMTGVVKS